MARSSHRPRSVFSPRGRTIAGLVGVAALFGALLSPTVAFAEDPNDAVISGTVVADASGTGIEGVYVSAELVADGGVFETVTEADGSYALTDLPAGAWVVSFAAPDDTDYISEYFSNATSIDEATAVTVGESEEAVADAALALGGNVTGTVRGVASAPLADVAVEAYPFGGGALLATATTDDTGTYVLHGLPSTGITISFTDDGDRGYVTKWSNNRANEDTADKITVASGASVAVNASLTIGGSITGQVRGGGGVVLPEGEVEVVLTLTSSDETVDSQFIDDAGDYAFTGVAAGNYIVQFADAAESGLSAQWWKNAATRQLATTIPVVSGQAVPAINAVMTTGASIAGAVTGSATTPVPLEDASVTLVDPAGEYVADAATDAVGAYTIAGLSAGTYFLSFDAPEGSLFSGEWWNNKPDFESSTAIVVAAGTALTGYNAVLASAGAISGTVTGSDKPTVGLEGVEVTAYNEFGDDVSTGTTDATGKYEVASLPAGTYRVRFETSAVPTYAPQWWKDKPNFDEALDIVVKSGVTTTSRSTVLKLGGTIAGQVTGGAPAAGLADVEVTAYDDQQSVISTTVTTETGDFVLRGIPAGSVTLGYHHLGDPAVYLDEYWLNAPSLDNATYFTTTAAGAITGKSVQLAIGATLSGIITGDDAPQAPLENVTVELFNAAHTLVTDTVTDTDGFYSFAALAPGTYKLSFTAAEGSEYGSEWWNNAVSFATASAIVLTEAAAATADAGLVDNPELLDEPPVPTIVGDVRVGKRVTADAGTWGPAPVELTYQWNSYDEPIAGATSSSLLVGVDYFDTELTVTVTGGKAGYLPRSVTSDVTDLVAPGAMPTVVPVISGTLAVGKTLKASTGKWSVPDVEYYFQWKNNGNEIVDATDATYKLQKSDAGDKISVAVTGSSYGYNDGVRSSASSVIQKLMTKTSTPKISGTAKVGKKLTAKAGTWKPSGVSFSYQWKRNGVAIKGATKSKYTVVKSDRKKKITVTVTGKKSTYTSVAKTSKAKKAK